MQGSQFDAIVRSVAASTSRRRLLKAGLGSALAAALSGVGLADTSAARRLRGIGKTCRKDAECLSGVCGLGSDGRRRCSSLCTVGTDNVSGATWTVCRSDANSAWISSVSGGEYHADTICQQLGYLRHGRDGGTCGSVCGYCEDNTSCSNPGTETYDGADTCGEALCSTVQWECVNKI